MTSSIASRNIPPAVLLSQRVMLSVSCLNKQFKAVALERGIDQGGREFSGQLGDSNNFQEMLRQAVETTGYGGKNVSFVFAHPRMGQQLVDVPPVKGATLRKIVERQAQQQKIISGEPAWAYQSCLPSKDARQGILHLIPRVLLDELAQACAANGLHLSVVAPVSSVIQTQLPQLPLEAGELALIAAETGGSTTVVIGQKDGQILLVRTLPGTWNDGGERLALDLNRTILFVNQQYGLAIKSLFLFGSGAQVHRDELQRYVQLPVEISPQEDESFYWARQAVSLKPANTPNFISPLLQQAPQRRAFAWVVGLSTLIVALMALSAFVYCSGQARQESANIETLRKQSVQLQSRRLDLQGRNSQLARKVLLTKFVLGNKPPPVPLWLLGYLSEACPPELVVTNLHIKQDADLWKVRLEGTVQTAATRSGSASFSNSVSLLNARLSDGPFHLQNVLTNDMEKEALTRKKESEFPDLRAKTTAPAASKPLAENQFLIEGVIR